MLFFLLTHYIPRLGVGAPIPETQSLAREATRLKSKLEGGKKRYREEETVESRQPQPESEEESRAGAIKKKARTDPFSMATKKKKKNTEVDGKNIPALHPAAFEALSRIHSDSIQEDSLEAYGSVRELPGTSESSEIHKKKKSKELQNQVKVSSSQVALPSIEIKSTGLNSTQNPSPPRATDAPRTPTLTSASLTQSSPTSSTVTQPKFVDVSLTTTPVLSPGRPIPDPRFLNQPLLNLAGWPSGGESDEDEKPGQSDLTPKKKRKRKKKRKKQNVEMTANKA